MKLTTGVNFINIFMYEFFIWTSFPQLFLVTFGFGAKILYENARVNVDEIESWTIMGQIPQRFIDQDQIQEKDFIYWIRNEVYWLSLLPSFEEINEVSILQLLYP